MDDELVVRGGTVVDGTGLSRRRADVRVVNGRIVDVGQVTVAPGPRVIDADGLVVAPGIVDVHTHYDPQLTFDPWATSSCYHGVTTIVAGNCGFSIAPCRPTDRGYLARLFAKVEGMAPAVLDAVDWDFETFPEYLQSRKGRLGVNIACYIGHTSVRRWVMGPEATTRAASGDEVTEMRAIVAAAMAAGAAGFSCSQAPTHLDGDGNPIPSRLASVEEVLALAEETGRSAGASICYLPKSVVNGVDEPADHDLLIEMALRSRVPVIIQGLGGRSKVDVPTAAWAEATDFLASTERRGRRLFAAAHPATRPHLLARLGNPALRRCDRVGGCAQTPPRRANRGTTGPGDPQHIAPLGRASQPGPQSRSDL